MREERRQCVREVPTRALTETRESEARYRALVEATAMIVWRASPDGSILDGCGWEKPSGQDPLRHRGGGWLDAVHPQDRDEVAAIWGDLVAKRLPFALECRVETSNGGYRWVRANAVPVLQADASVREWVGTITDIQEMKLAQELLRESEERYRALVEATATTVWRTHANGAEAAPQSPPSHFVQAGDHWERAVHPDDRGASHAAWTTALATATPLDVIERKLTIHGDFRWTHVRAQPLMREDGTVREWVGAVTDIHDRVMSERALQASEERYRLALRATTDAVWDWDLDTGRVFWGDAVYDILGCSREEFPCDSGFEVWYRRVHPDDRERVDALVRGFIENHEQRLTYRYRLLRSDGSYVSVLDRAYLIRDEAGRPVRMVGAMQDISEREQAQEAIRESEERLRLALRASQMVAWERKLGTDYVRRSENAMELLGVGSGPTGEFLARVHPEDRQAAVDFIESCGRTYGYTVELRYFPPGGRQIWLAMRAEKSSPDRVIGITFDITDRKAAEEEIWRTANHDPLTGLPNRALFQKRLEEALAAAEAHGTSVSLLLVDLDAFKDVNDSLGHDAGDALLHEAARRLAAMAGGEFVARIGGDEFAMILTAPLTLQGAMETAGRIVEGLRVPFHCHGRLLSTKSSVGVAAYPDHHREAAELMKDADIALYRAKAAGKGRAAVYTEAAREETQRRIHILREVRAGLEEEKFLPFYQPKVCLKTGRIIGFEALARWKHPVTGILTPGYFGSAFADAEIAVALGDKIAAHVIADMRSWIREGLEFGHVALNLSSAEFADPDLAHRLLRRLGENGLPTSLIEVEVTETVLLGRATDAVLAILMHFHQAGVKVALDDFGTGFASLSHLKQFPVDHIKIDQSFVRDLAGDRNNHAIVAAIIGLSKNLEIAVTAEGVETREQAQILAALDCDHAQGFFYARPTIGSRIPWLLREWDPSGIGVEAQPPKLRRACGT